MVQSANDFKGRDNKENLYEDDLLVLSIDNNGNILHFNMECERISGYSRSEILDKNIFDFFVPKDYGEQWKSMLQWSNTRIWK